MDTDLIFAALAHGTRRAMTESLLRHGPQAMSRLGAPHGISLPGIKKHLGVLEKAGIVTSRKIGREKICAVNPAALSEAGRWFEAQARFWSQSFDRLDKLLKGA